MKMQIKFLTLLSLTSGILLSSSFSVFSQKDDVIIEINAKIRTEDKSAAPTQVLVYQDNEQIQSFTAEKNSFNLELGLQRVYTVQIRKAGYEPYNLYIDGNTSINIDENQKMKMDVILQAKEEGSDPYYSDFPNVIMTWNERTSMFAERTHYSSHILGRKQSLQAANIE
jgi:hypothetical protein